MTAPPPLPLPSSFFLCQNSPMKINFDAEIEKLNSEQKKAVEALYGPVLLIAGPGTGKTRVLTMRIANILQKTDTNPKNIIALTFTENAAAEMQRRLSEMIGSVAYDVQIKTFHAFANDIIQAYPEKFAFAHKLEPVDELAQVQILKNVVEKVRPRNLISFANPVDSVGKIRTAISSLKREGYDAEKFRQTAEAEKAAFEAIPEEEKRGPRGGVNKQYQALEKDVPRWLELAEVFEVFEKELRSQGFYDFDDMILFVLEKLKTDDELVFDLRERFLFFLVDEFQDTSGAQLALLQAVLEKDQPNVFAVGDADQSIYRFQGASMENIIRFREHFGEAQILPLQRNYRSSSEIVDLSQELICVNCGRIQGHLPDLEWDKIVAHNGENLQKTTVSEFESADAEMFDILQMIQKLHLEGVPFAEMAIIFRKNNEGEKWLNYCERNDIPATFEGRSNALASVYVRQFLLILELIDNPFDNELFFKVLNFRFLNIASGEIWTTFAEIEERKSTFWRYFLEEPAEKAPQCAKFAEKVRVWQKDLLEMSFPDFLRKVFAESGFLAYLLGENTLKVEALNHLSALFSEAERLFFADQKTFIKEFLALIQLRDEFNIPLVKKEFFTRPDTVKLLTAHKAKGLEFEVVFVPNLVKGNWGDSVGFKGLKLPIKLQSAVEDEEKIEEERRLFYVAITRAKKQLFLSYCNKNENGKEKAKSRFLTELKDDLLTKRQEAGNRENLPEQIEAKMRYCPPDEAAKSLELLRQKVAPEKFALSHTVFEDYRKCPRKCFYDHILRVPRKKPYSLILGTGVHAGLEAYFKKMRTDGAPPPPAIAIEGLINAVNRQIGDPLDKENAIFEGKEILSAYLKEKAGVFGEVAEVELNFRDHHVLLQGTIPLTGKVDKIEFIDKVAKRVRLIDYKTGSVKSANDIRGLTQRDEINPGGNYRQLIFFAILAAEDENFPYTIESFELHFLEKNASGKYKEEAFLPTTEEIEAHKKEIAEVWAKFQSLEFPKVHPERKKEVCEKIEGRGGQCPFFAVCWGEGEEG